MDNNKINEAALTKRLKTLVLQGRYEDAQKELEDIDIQRLKNNSILCLAGEVYMGLNEYNEAERVLLRVYEKNPTARRILDLLTTLYIEKGEYSEAEYYYKEFISVASKDLHRYILRYRIDKGKKERLSVLIQTLEKLKEYEYIEEWAYELARLYDESGQTKKCLHECEEIVLWFGHGEYVDKAIALRCKLTGEPLPELTTVEMYEAEEERRAKEEKEQEKVYEEISRSSAEDISEPVVDGMEEEFDGSIDTDMIQETLEGRQEKPEEDKAADEEDDEVLPENVLEPAVKEEKESITQVFGSLMSGKLFGKLLQGKKEEKSEAEEEEEKSEASESAAEEENAQAAEIPAEDQDTAAEGETVSAEESEEESLPSGTEDSVDESEPAAEEPAAEEAETESADTEAEEVQEDDEILEEELDLSIFEMKADQAFEDSIIESMDASFRASYGENPNAGAEEPAAELPDTVAEEEPAEELSEAAEEAEETKPETEDEPAKEGRETAEEPEDEIIEIEEEPEDEIIEIEEETVEQQAASFAEAISAAVGEPSAFIREQTEGFVSEAEEAEAEAEPETETEAETETETEAEAEAEAETETETEAEAEAEAEPETEEEAEAESEPVVEEEAEAEAEPVVEEEAEAEVETETEAEAEAEAEPVVEEEAEAEPEPVVEEEAEAEPEPETEAEEDAEDEIACEAAAADDDEDDDEDEIITDDDDEYDEIIDGEDDFMKSLFAEAPAAAEEAAETVPEEEDTEDEFSDSLQASDTVMDIFGAVAEVKSIKQQLTETFTKFEFQDSIDLLAPYDINFVVTGEDMSVKSQIAIGIAKALNTYQICDKNKLVRAGAEDLNGRDFSSIFPRLKGGCLIIESADKLNENAVQIISDYIQQEEQDVAIVLEGEEKPLMEMFSRNRLLRQRFLNIIHIGKYNESELVQLATGYAKKKGYEVSKDASPVLKTLFRDRMKRGDSVNYEDIIEIVENAISSLERRNMENLFMTVLDNKYEEAAMFLLQPQDFEPAAEESADLP